MKMSNGTSIAIPLNMRSVLSTSTLAKLGSTARQLPHYPSQQSRSLVSESGAEELIIEDDSGNDDDELSTAEVVCISCVAFVVFLFALCIVCQFGKKLWSKCVDGCRKKQQRVKMHALEAEKEEQVDAKI